MMYVVVEGVKKCIEEVWMKWFERFELEFGIVYVHVQGASEVR